MNIDGHTIRTGSIDAATPIEVIVGTVGDGSSDRMARGYFDILIRGQRITVARSKRFHCNDELLRETCVNMVRHALMEIRNPIIIALRDFGAAV